MYKHPRKFFTRFLLLTLFTFINIAVIAGLSATGVVGLWIALFLVILNAFLLMAMFVISIINMFKSFFDKESEHTGFHIVNFIFALAMNALFSIFYIMIVLGAMTLILPFL